MTDKQTNRQTDGHFVEKHPTINNINLPKQMIVKAFEQETNFIINQKHETNILKCKHENTMQHFIKISFKNNHRSNDPAMVAEWSKATSKFK